MDSQTEKGEGRVQRPPTNFVCTRPRLHTSPRTRLRRTRRPNPQVVGLGASRKAAIRLLGLARVWRRPPTEDPGGVPWETENRPAPEFRREAVRLVLTSGRTRREIAEDLGIGLSTLTRFLSRESDASEPGKAPVDVHAELKRLRQENAVLKQERDILKTGRHCRAIVPSDDDHAFFAKEGSR